MEPSKPTVDNEFRGVPPRLISWPELQVVMTPYMHGWSWANDALWDLWTMGAPVPQDKCPGDAPCRQYPKCNHIRRILLPNYFAKWYEEVRQRMSLEWDHKTAYKR